MLLPRPIVRYDSLHIRIPPKCYIYVMTTTGRQSWMRPGVYVGTQFGGDMLSECHVRHASTYRWPTCVYQGQRYGTCAHHLP